MFSSALEVFSSVDFVTFASRIGERLDNLEEFASKKKY
jgi:hypothetical protein